MGNSRLSAYRFAVPVAAQLGQVSAQLEGLVSGRSNVRGELAFEWMVVGEFSATREEAVRIATWAQRMLAHLPPFMVKVFGISAQPPARLFLRTMPSQGQQLFHQLITQLNNYLQQYELPLVKMQQAFRIPATADCLSLSCFEYLDHFRTVAIEKNVPMHYVQLQKQNKAGQWEPAQNMFLQQAEQVAMPASTSLQAVSV